MDTGKFEHFGASASMCPSSGTVKRIPVEHLRNMAGSVRPADQIKAALVISGDQNEAGLRSAAWDDALLVEASRRPGCSTAS